MRIIPNKTEQIRQRALELHRKGLKHKNIIRAVNKEYQDYLMITKQDIQDIIQKVDTGIRAWTTSPR